MSFGDILALIGVLIMAGSLLYWMYKSNNKFNHTN